MRFALSVLCLILAVGALLAVPTDGRAGARPPDVGVPELQQRALAVGDLAWVDPAGLAIRPGGTGTGGADIVRERASRAGAGARVAGARLNAVFASGDHAWFWTAG